MHKINIGTWISYKSHSASTFVPKAFNLALFLSQIALAFVH